MGNPALSNQSVDMRSAQARVQEIESAEKRIKAQLHSVEEQLRRLDQMHVPDSQPWVTFKTVNSIQELKSLHPSLRSALRQDVSELRDAYRRLQSELRTARQQSSLATLKAQEQTVAVHYHEWERRMRELLNQWKVTGVQPKAELEKALGQAEKVLDQQIAVLNIDPSRENMRAVLKSMASFSLMGRDSERGFGAIRAAAERRVKMSIITLRINPTRANIKVVLNRSAEAQLVGSDVAGEEGISAAREGIIKVTAEAERQFRSVPTVANFKILLKLQHEQALLDDQMPPPDQPRGLHDAPKGPAHIVSAGESLSQISAYYFGRPGYWDVIMWRNVGVIHDPNALPVGITLIIA